MKPILFALALAVMPLGGCATAPLAQGGNVLVVAKAEYAFEETYNIAAHAYLDAVKAGALTPAQHDAAKPLLQRAYQAVLAARKAKALGNATDVATQAQLVMDLSHQVASIINPGH